MMEYSFIKCIFSHINLPDQGMHHQCIQHGNFCNFASLKNQGYVSINHSEHYHMMRQLYKMVTNMIDIY